MNFTLLFAVVGNLNFIVNFLINADEKQAFFLFDGVNSSAYFYRNNHTVFLYLSKESNLEIYKTDILNRLEFSWLGFKVNGTEMEKIKSTGKFDVEFNAFTFISPILNTQSDMLKEMPLDNPKEEKTFNFKNLENINYGYIVGIVLIVAIVFDSKPKVYQIIRRLFNKAEKSEYETMEKVESIEELEIESIENL